MLLLLPQVLLFLLLLLNLSANCLDLPIKSRSCSSCNLDQILHLCLVLLILELLLLQNTTGCLLCLALERGCQALGMLSQLYCIACFLPIQGQDMSPD